MGVAVVSSGAPAYLNGLGWKRPTTSLQNAREEGGGNVVLPKKLDE